ncbi:MAG: YrzE family protein [Treponema sp.]|nr:YrzE family protein [Treponema sp.]
MNGEMDELDEKEREKRKQDQIAYRKKQTTSNTFLFLGTICEIIISLAFVLLLFLISVVLLYRILSLPEKVTEIVFNILLIVSFIGGLVLGFKVYKRLGRWVINKWELKDKLREDVLNQFKTAKEFKEYYEKKKQR